MDADTLRALAALMVDAAADGATDGGVSPEARDRLASLWDLADDADQPEAVEGLASPRGPSAARVAASVKAFTLSRMTRGVSEAKDASGHEHDAKGLFTGTGGGGAAGDSAPTHHDGRKLSQAGREKAARNAEREKHRKALADYAKARGRWEDAVAAHEDWQQEHAAWENEKGEIQAQHEQEHKKWQERQSARDERREKLAELALPASAEIGPDAGPHLAGLIDRAKAAGLDAARLEAAAGKARAAVAKAAERQRAAAEASDAAAKALADHEAQEPPEPDYPGPILDRPKLEDYPQHVAGQVQWREDWEAVARRETIAQAEWEDAHPKEAEAYHAAVEKWQPKHDRWEEKRDRLSEKADAADEKVQAADEALGEVWEEKVGGVEEMLSDMATDADSELDSEDAADSEPDEPDIPDEPEEPPDPGPQPQRPRLRLPKEVGESCVPNRSGRGHHDDHTGHPCSPGGAVGGGKPATARASGSKPARTPRPGGGKAASERLARFSSPAVRRRVLHGLRNEGELAKALGGHNLPDSEPADVVMLSKHDGEVVTDPVSIKSHLRLRADLVARLPGMTGRTREEAERFLAQHPLRFVEVKTLVTSPEGRIRMSAKAARRKEAWAKKYAADFYTVAFDDRRGKKHSGSRLYWKAGVGSSRLADMTPAASFDDLLQTGG